VTITRDSGDTDFDTLGETGGAKTHTLTESEIPSHTHAISANQSATTTATGSQNRLTALSAGTTGNDDATSAATGGSGAHNNVQPYMVLNHIIKT
jgi:microcystin-dependent protein